MTLDPPTDHNRPARLLVLLLLGGWLAGTALVLQANAVAPTTLPVSASSLGKLHDAWGWYAAGYALFFTSDTAIALLGAALIAWLRPPDGWLGPAMVVLFGLSGVLGILADLRMLAAAQAFRLGSPALVGDAAAVWLDDLNTGCNWLSAASFLPGGIATWLARSAAKAAGIGRGWVAFTGLGALYQVAAGLISAASFLGRNAILSDIALLAAVVGMPLFATIWLVWMLREMSTFPNRRQPS